MKPFTFIFRSYDGNRVVSYYYFDSFEILLEFFLHTFGLNDDIKVEFYVNDRIGKLDLGEIPLLSFCYEDCGFCNKAEIKECYRKVFTNFIKNVQSRLEEETEKKTFEEFVAGRVTYKVVS